jgi:hypothetical protein
MAGGQPKIALDFERLDLEPRPPLELLARAMRLTVMGTAQRHGEFVADLLRQSGLLSKAD